MVEDEAYIVADRASENVPAFLNRYICCFAHQLQNCFKFAICTMRNASETGPLVTTLAAITSQIAPLSAFRM